MVQTETSSADTGVPTSADAQAIMTSHIKICHHGWHVSPAADDVHQPGLTEFADSRLANLRQPADEHKLLPCRVYTENK